MNDRSLMATGGVAAVLAAICCATPILAVILGGIGLAAWIAIADYVVLPVLVLGVALVAIGLYRRRVNATCVTTTATPNDPK
jgi:mercuric ion transport protein